MCQNFKYFNLISLLFIFVFSAKAQNNSFIEPFDSNWMFIHQDIQRAEKSNFDDSSWRKLDVPHDWSIEGPYDETNPTGRGGGYLPSGIGWYRKSFTLPSEASSKKIFLEFDGIMANSDVWINGFLLGHRPYGYSSFEYELTSHLKTGKNNPNIIAVRVDDSQQPASRFYTGAGIYRHVRLIETNPVHFDHWGIYVSDSQVNDKKATLAVQSSILNQSTKSENVILVTTLINPTGKTIKSSELKKTIAAGEKVTVNEKIEVLNPDLWSTDQPQLYRLISKISKANQIIDEQVTTVGIRDSKFDAATGYWLNGKNIKIKGVCLHSDGGAVGSAVPLAIWEYRFKLLKEVGVNAIRTAHNPVAPEFLDLCDRMGFLVLDENFDTWNAAKQGAEKGYNLYFSKWWEKDTRDMVLRDRNHPSIIMYSVGNEIRDNLNDSAGFQKYRNQQNLIHSLDPARPVTMALFRPNSSKVYTNGFADMMDVVGQNYREQELVAAHIAHPNWKVIGTENSHTLPEWLILRDKPFMAGQFLWTGFDYLGEAQWPNISYDKGLFDRTGGWKPIGLQRQSWWSTKPVVHIVRKEDNDGVGDWVANWSPVDQGTYDQALIQVYSNCDEVELFLNNKSLGIKTKPANDAPRELNTSFEKGTLKAVGKINGQIAATEEFKTAGEPNHIQLTASKNKLSNSSDDVVIIKATVVDDQGITCPNIDKIITFNTSENGKVIAVDNGNALSHETYQDNKRHTYNGSCIAIIRAKSNSGQITVTAGSPELKSGSVMIDIE